MTKSYKILQAIYDKTFDNTDYKNGTGGYDDTISDISSQSIDRDRESMTITTKDGTEYTINIVATYKPVCLHAHQKLTFQGVFCNTCKAKIN